jgi:hypothetical protein
MHSIYELRVSNVFHYQIINHLLGAIWRHRFRFLRLKTASTMPYMALEVLVCGHANQITRCTKKWNDRLAFSHGSNLAAATFSSTEVQWCRKVILYPSSNFSSKHFTVITSQRQVTTSTNRLVNPENKLQYTVVFDQSLQFLSNEPHTSEKNMKCHQSTDSRSAIRPGNLLHWWL